MSFYTAQGACFLFATVEISVSKHCYFFSSFTLKLSKFYMVCFNTISAGDIKEFCLMHLLKMFWHIFVKVQDRVSLAKLLCSTSNIEYNISDVVEL